MRVPAASSLVIPALLLGSPASAESLRCEGRLVGEGDTALELKARCGAPDHVETRAVLSARGVERLDPIGPLGRGGVRATSVPTRVLDYVREELQTWTYLGRPGDLARVVTIRRGKVARVETVSGLDLQDDPGCARVAPSRGTRLGVVRLSCGAPDDMARWEEVRERTVAGVVRRRLVVRERWTYAPGDGRFLRILEFANGRLSGIETGGKP